MIGCVNEQHSQELLRLGMVIGLAVALAVLLVGLGRLVGSSSSDELVRKLGLVRGVGDLMYMSVSGMVCCLSIARTWL